MVIFLYNFEDENYVYYLAAMNLRRIREEKNITQAELAEKSNYSEGFIMNIESKKYFQSFSLGTLWRFAIVLKVDIREFFLPIDERH